MRTDENHEKVQPNPDKNAKLKTLKPNMADDRFKEF